MKRRRPADRLDIQKFRGAVWRMIIEILRAVHADRFPKGNHFGADAEKILVYGAIVLLYLEENPLRISKIAQFLDLPNQTARRHVAKLMEYGLVEREDHTLRLPAKIANIPAGHRDMVARLLKQVTPFF